MHRITETSPVETVAGLKSAEIFLRDYLGECDSCSLETGALVLRDCTATQIFVDVPVGTVHIFNLQSCEVTLCAVKGSVHIRKSQSTILSGFCGQLRVSDSDRLTLSMQTSSSTALANSRNITVTQPPQISQSDDFQRCLSSFGLLSDEFLNSPKWKNVRDFDCLHGSSPNWSFS